MQEAASQKTTIVYEAPTPEASAVAGPEPARRSKVKMSITEEQIGNSVEAALASCFSPELKNQINRDVLTIQIRSALTDLLQNSQVQVIKNQPEITPKPDNPTTVPVWAKTKEMKFIKNIKAKSPSRNAAPMTEQERT